MYGGTIPYHHTNITHGVEPTRRKRKRPHSVNRYGPQYNYFTSRDYRIIAMRIVVWLR